MTSSLRSKLGMSIFGTLATRSDRRKTGSVKASYFPFTVFPSQNFLQRSAKITTMKGMKRLELKTLKLLLHVLDSSYQISTQLSFKLELGCLMKSLKQTNAEKSS
jgi:hypothetical protein